MDYKPFDFVTHVDVLRKDFTFNDYKINDNSIIVTRDQNKVREPYIHFNNTNWNFTHDYILNWLKGKCKEVILVGAADFENDRHYNTSKPFRYAENCKNNSLKLIESITDFKIYKANPNGKLNIEHKDITMLYKCKTKKKKVLR